MPKQKNLAKIFRKKKLDFEPEPQSYVLPIAVSAVVLLSSFVLLFIRRRSPKSSSKTSSRGLTLERRPSQRELIPPGEELTSTVSKRINEHFSGAITNETFANKLDDMLKGHGYAKDRTLLATSLCCDEVNRDLEDHLAEKFNDNFSMGGLAGFAFGGVTSFSAMASHIPHGGSCVIVFGPHVGVDIDGNVGMVNRRGHAHSDACCGSATAACGYVCKVIESGDQPASPPDDVIDAQQYFVNSLLMQEGERLVNAANRDVEVAYALFDSQYHLMKKIVHLAANKVPGDGKIALVGGIQVNTPVGHDDFFLMKTFEVVNSSNETLFTDAKVERPVASKLNRAFRGAVSNEVFTGQLEEMLSEHGYEKSKTLLATSLCCDEVNRDLEEYLAVKFNRHFAMGGLAGFAFGGITSFGAMASHIPHGGSCVIVYGPHVGIDADGNVGKVNRRGHHESDACCGSATAASNYVCAVVNETIDEAPPPNDVLDAQQYFVNSLLLPFGNRLVAAKEQEVEVAYCMFDAQKDLLKQIVMQSCDKVQGDGKIALVGGIQVNTPDGYEDYFLLKDFEVVDNKGEILEAEYAVEETADVKPVDKSQLTDASLFDVEGGEEEEEELLFSNNPEEDEGDGDGECYYIEEQEFEEEFASKFGVTELKEELEDVKEQEENDSGEKEEIIEEKEEIIMKNTETMNTMTNEEMMAETNDETMEQHIMSLEEELNLAADEEITVKTKEDEGKLQISRKMSHSFPGALRNVDFSNQLEELLVSRGYTQENTLLATSLCSEELNRDLEGKLVAKFGENFSMGGLAGFPFGGITSYGTFASHIPNGGACVIVYGPHIGIDSAGRVGMMHRRGGTFSEPCCGSACAALEYVAAVRANMIPELTAPEDPLDAQQYFVGKMLLPEGDRLEKAFDPHVELPYAMYDVQEKMVKKIVTTCLDKVKSDGKIILVGGIQINTPKDHGGDYFLMQNFEILDSEGQVLECM